MPHIPILPLHLLPSPSVDGFTFSLYPELKCCPHVLGKVLVSLWLSSFPPGLEFSFQNDFALVSSVSTSVVLVTCPQQCSDV